MKKQAKHIIKNKNKNKKIIVILFLIIITIIVICIYNKNNNILQEVVIDKTKMVLPQFI